MTATTTVAERGAAAPAEASVDTVTMTPPAVAHIKRYAAAAAKDSAVRIGVKTSSCSAHAYTLELDGRVEKDDRVFDCDGVKLVIDPKSMLYLAGTQIDYRREGIQEGFHFENPNVKGSCGCGQSFTV